MCFELLIFLYEVRNTIFLYSSFADVLLGLWSRLMESIEICWIMLTSEIGICKSLITALVFFEPDSLAGLTSRQSTFMETK